jgi:hypothetical protein
MTRVDINDNNQSSNKTQPLDEERSPCNDGDIFNEQPNVESNFGEEKGDERALKRVTVKKNKKGGMNKKKVMSHQ